MTKATTPQMKLAPKLLWMMRMRMLRTTRKSSDTVARNHTSFSGIPHLPQAYFGNNSHGIHYSRVKNASSMTPLSDICVSHCSWLEFQYTWNRTEAVMKGHLHS